MDTNLPKVDDEVVCFCSGTTKAKVKTLIAKGATSVEKITYATGAGTGCGGCDVMLATLIKECVKNK